MAKEDRGFASMDRNKQREIASKGGKAAHQKGTAHEWTSEEAREAGRKGGMASHRRKQGDDIEGSPKTGSASARSQWPWGPDESMARGSGESMRGSEESMAPGSDESMSEASDESMPRGNFGRSNFGDDDVR